jgi:hypothetical protein
MASNDSTEVKDNDILKNRRTGLIVKIEAGPETVYLTSWGRDISVSSGEAVGNYKQVSQINYEEVKRSLSMDNSEMSLTVPLDGSGIQARIITNPNVKIEVRVWEVTKADLVGNTGPEHVRRIWYGKGKGISVGKTFASINVKSALDPESVIGRTIYQSQDQRDPADIVEVSDLKVSTTIHEVGPIREHWVIVNELASDPFYYEGGILKFSGNRVRIESSEIVEGRTKLILHFTPHELQSGDALDIYPGYDGSIESARTKFPGRDLITGFQGFPYIPVRNPATSGVS